jgi:hypothetical protein
MSASAKHLEYRPLHAPREDGTALVEPSFEDVPALVARNVRCRGQYRYDFHGLPLAELSRQARAELLAEAVRWTSSYRDVDFGPLDPSGRVFLAGHQPQLFHPGVWFKNFALGALARQQGATAVNLIIDSDTIKTSALRVPGGAVDRPQVAPIPFDASGPVIPYEERRILDRPTFGSFGDRAVEQIAPLVPDPLVREYWPLAVERAAQSENLGACLAQSRHQMEGRWGLETLEIPQSRVCETPSFAWFTVHLLAELPRLREVYNEAVSEYRRLHHIRSTAHPVPDLAMEGEWIEAPYWIWSAGDPRRRRLFVRQSRRELVLSDRQSLEIVLPLAADGDPQRAVERLIELPRQGIKLRSRALVTTLWARLVLGDLFLHGIGGAKYDQLTDALIDRFFALRPPGFLVLSATLQLPVPRRRPTVEEARAIDRRLRDLVWHPEKALDPADGRNNAQESSDLIAAKARWIQTPPTPENARTRFREIRRVNEALQPFVEDQRERLVLERSRLAATLKAESILAWREHGFCLYPGQTLRAFLEALLPRGG